jgi:hypothetical protein
VFFPDSAPFYTNWLNFENFDGLTNYLVLDNFARTYSINLPDWHQIEKDVL